MKSVQRIEANPKQLNLLLDSLEKYPNFFTDVWLCTEYGYPKNEVHRQTADTFAEFADILRKKGIRVSMQLSNTIGHGQYMMTLDCSGLIYEGSPVRKMVGQDGTVAEYTFCWNDKHFTDYITEHVYYYVKRVKPAEFWIDDDLRADNHAPVEFGCFCDDCIAKFNRLHGTDFTRERLTDEFLHGDISVRENYISFIREGIARFTREICLAVKSACPDTVVSLQNGNHGPFTGYGHGYILDAMYETTGHAPSYRAGGGTYTDHNPNEIVYKVLEADRQHSMLPSYVNELCPEIENTPCVAMGKTMHGTALETALNLANGATDISYAMLSRVSENAEFYQNGFKLFSEQRHYYERLSEISGRSLNGGITFAYSKFAHLRPLSNNSSFADFSAEFFRCADSLTENAIPITHFERENGVYLLHPLAARHMTMEELRRLCEKNVITDTETVFYLKSVGIDLGIEGRPCNEAEILTLSETYSEHSVNDVGNTEFNASFFSPGYSSFGVMTKIPDTAQVLGTYKIDREAKAQSEAAEIGFSSVIIKTERGGNWAVIGYGLWKYVVPSYQRNRIINIIDYISCNALAARINSPYRNMLMPRVCKASGKTLAVSLLNCTVEPQTNIELVIRRPEAEKFSLISQYDGEFELPHTNNKDEYTVTIPKISPWSVATVFCDKKTEKIGK